MSTKPEYNILYSVSAILNTSLQYVQRKDKEKNPEPCCIKHLKIMGRF